VGRPYPMYSFDMSAGEPRITGPTLKVSGAPLSLDRAELSGAEIACATKLASGSIYQILFPLERAGWLEGRSEDDDPKALLRRRRRFYRVTDLGARNGERRSKTSSQASET
jgi:PadR family transcriptional regulator, regulatory protein PadR